MQTGVFRRHCLPYWKSIVIIAAPLILLPLPLLVNTAAAKTGFVILLMSIYWIGSVLPLAVTSLIPIALLPMLNVMSTDAVCGCYFNESNVVFFCGVILAIGVEQSQLHQRIALRILILFGTNPKWLMLAFMTVGMSLSMWITNSAVAAMLIPIVRSLTDEIFIDSDVECQGRPERTAEAAAAAEEIQTGRSAYKNNVIVALNLSIAYSISIGGSATLIGSGSPIVLKGLVAELFGPKTDLTFPSFMGVAVPIAIVNMLLTWLWLCAYLIGIRSNKNSIHLKDPIEVRNTLGKQYKELGPVTFHQAGITLIFLLLICMWFFKDPQFIPGWISFFPDDYEMGDGTIGMIFVILAFMIPARPNFCCFGGDQNSNQVPTASPGLLDWKSTNEHFQWGVLLLLGGGYAIADASKVSLLLDWLGQQLAGLSVLPSFVLMILSCVITSTLTEISSNTATASILLPVLAELKGSSEVNPLYFMIPAAIHCSYAFMLPVGTPCNAMVAAAGKIPTSTMVSQKQYFYGNSIIDWR